MTAGKRGARKKTKTALLHVGLQEFQQVHVPQMHGGFIGCPTQLPLVFHLDALIALAEQRINLTVPHILSVQYAVFTPAVPSCS